MSLSIEPGQLWRVDMVYCYSFNGIVDFIEGVFVSDDYSMKIHLRVNDDLSKKHQEHVRKAKWFIMMNESSEGWNVFFLPTKELVNCKVHKIDNIF